MLVHMEWGAHRLDDLVEPDAATFQRHVGGLELLRHPALAHPAMTRPLLNWSSVANRRASITGGWNSASMTLVPS
jgi:hypothetical protein